MLRLWLPQRQLLYHQLHSTCWWQPQGAAPFIFLHHLYTSAFCFDRHRRVAASISSDSISTLQKKRKGQKKREALRAVDWAAEFATFSDSQLRRAIRGTMDITVSRPPSRLPGMVFSAMASICKDGWECDWESMTDEEFEGFLSTLQGTTKGVPRSRFATIEEYKAFRKRHGHYLVLVSKELSGLFKGLDLITHSKARKGYDDEPSDADDVPFNFPTYVKAEADKTNKSKRSM